jgi:hypothetical protein
LNNVINNGWSVLFQEKFTFAKVFAGFWVAYSLPNWDDMLRKISAMYKHVAQLYRKQNKLKYKTIFSVNGW